MSVGNTNSYIDHAGDGSSAQFAFGFPAISANDIKCRITHADGSTEELQSTAYSVVFSGTGGIVTVAVPPASGETLRIYRTTPITQDTGFDTGYINNADISNAMDKLTLIAQELKRAADGIMFSVGTVAQGTPAAASITDGKLNLTLPKGDKGDTGATGPANSLSIGTVTSGASCSATITGSAPNQTLNLVLEKGDTGATGETGAAGADGKDGQGLAIGTVYFSQSSSASDNPGGLPLFTGETIANADEVYPDFYNWVNSHSALKISAADYATAINTYGECAKYVIDTVNKTITLPLLKTFVKMANTTDGITEGEAGLPNITGEFNGGNNGNGDVTSGAFSLTSTLTGAGYANLQAQDHIGVFNASGSNAIYGNSNTVTPQHTTLYPWVFAFNAAVPASTAQAAQFQAALSGKVDLPTGVAQADVDYVIETYTSGTSWYRIYKSGWCEQGGQTNIASGSGNYSLAFLQDFADTNYNFLCQPEITDTSTTYADRLGVYRIIGAVYSKATTGVQIQYDSSTFTGKFFWSAEGYLAQGD